MKKQFLKFMPLMAAVLLATSCSKDDDNNNAPTQNTATKTDGKITIPFSVTVSNCNGSPLSKKMTYTDNGEDGLTVKFAPEQGEELTLSGKGITGVLKYDTETDLFSGDVEADDADAAAAFAAGNIDITYTYGEALKEPAFSNAPELSTLVAVCDHQFKGVFKSNVDDITLTDQNAYLKISMSVDQHALDVKSGDAKAVECKLSTTGYVWVAVPTGANLYVGSFIRKEADEVEASRIYTISRPNCVDLGITDGVLWTDYNIEGENGTKEGNYTYYTFENAAKDVPEGWVLPTGGSNGDFQKLFDECYWVWDDTQKGYNVFKSKDKDLDKGLTKGTADDVTYDASDTHIFLPAAGYINNNGILSQVGIETCHWAANSYDGWCGYCLRIKANEARPATWQGPSSGYSVRAIRRKQM